MALMAKRLNGLLSYFTTYYLHLEEQVRVGIVRHLCRSMRDFELSSRSKDIGFEFVFFMFTITVCLCARVCMRVCVSMFISLR